MTRAGTPIPAVTVSAAFGTWSFSFSDGTVMDFDAAGRPVSIHEKGILFVRGHDGRWQEKRWMFPGALPQRQVRFLPEGEAVRLEGRLHRRIGDVQRDLTLMAKQGRFRDIGRSSASLSVWRTRLEVVLTTLNRLPDDAALFRRLYLPVPILPPDQYLAWVLQVVEGCPWNKCVFCEFYPKKPSRLRSLEEIRRHVEASEKYFGAALERRASIFIGDADAFAAPPETLLSLCRWLARRHPRLTRPSDDGAWGFHSFGETRSLLSWPEKGLRALVRTGFRRVTVGLESGDDGVRRWLKKPGRAADVRRAVEKVKGSGFSVGLVTLLGAGGRAQQVAHREGTARLLASLPLGEGDIVYLSPLKESQGEPHRKALKADGRVAVGEAQLTEQAEAFRAAVASRSSGGRSGRGPLVALYDIDEFLY